MKHRTSEIAMAAATVVSFALFLVVPGPQVPWWAVILAGLMGTLSLGVLISIRRQLRGMQRKLSLAGLEQAVERLLTAQEKEFERISGRLGEVEGNLLRVHTHQLHAERSRAKADNRTHEALATVRRDIRPGFADDLSGRIDGITERLDTSEARVSGFESTTHERLNKILLAQNTMERSRARSVTRTHELVRRNENDIRESLRRVGSVESDLRSLQESMKALRDLMVEASVALDVLTYSSASDDALAASVSSGRDVRSDGADR
ncbi:hypothetical protein ACH9EU_06060 [Kocuria sp. M1R5S2]|uniref:hypothetical protein n=1 Tax=Kocuria rhizosphaerae TaxID=3376285 RepID=UPI00379A4A1E